MVTDDHPTGPRSATEPDSDAPTPGERIAAEAARFDAVLSEADPAAPVSACPGWTALDLLWHGTQVHEFWSAVLATGALTDADAEAADASARPRPEGPDAREQMLERRRAATAALLAQLTARADTEEAWTWFPADRSVGFTRRMQLHEATVHRVDAELTAGHAAISPIDPGVAADGLDHVVGVMWAAGHEWIPAGAWAEPLAVLRLAPDDGGPAREVEISRVSGTSPYDGREAPRLLARPLPADSDTTGRPLATASGSTAALYLWMWGRGEALGRMAAGPAEVSLGGDDTAAHRVEALLAQGID